MSVAKSRKVGGCMSLFGEQQTVHSKDQKIKTTLAELAGAGAGAGIGLVGMKLGNIKYHNDALKAGLEHTQDLKDSEQNWRTMMGIHNGDIDRRSLDEFDQRRFLNLMDEHKDDLEYMKQHPREAESMIRDMASGQVVPLHPEQAKPSQMNQLLESFKKKRVELGGNVVPLFEDERIQIPHMLENPKLNSLPPLLGLAGMYGAGILAKKHFDNENQGQQETHDLNRLQEMLAKLKEKESQSNH